MEKLKSIHYVYGSVGFWEEEGEKKIMTLIKIPELFATIIAKKIFWENKRSFTEKTKAYKGQRIYYEETKL